MELEGIQEQCARTRPISNRGFDLGERPNTAEALKARSKREKRRKKRNRKATSLLSDVSLYFTAKNKYPFQDMGTMIDFLQTYPHIRRHPADCLNKIRKLRKKYMKLWRKHGENLEFIDPQLQEAYEFWKKIWGADLQPQPQETDDETTDGSVSANSFQPEEPIAAAAAAAAWYGN